MPIKTRRFPIWQLALLAISLPYLLPATPEAMTPAVAAAMQVNGTVQPSAATANLSMEAALQAESDALHANSSLQESVRLRAFLDAFGLHPTSAQAPSGSPLEGVAHYSELLKQHLAWLETYPSAYEAVIQRAYQTVIYRDAYEEEIEYWMQRNRQSYLVLVACIEDWARRNQPGLMVTTGTATVSVNCEFLTTLPLDPELAQQVRSAMQLPASAQVLTPGADSIASSGNIPFLLVAGSDLHL